MNINDIIALAKSGYKKKDIDELLKLEVPEPAAEPVPDPEPAQPIENGQKDDAEDVAPGEDSKVDDSINEQIEAAQKKIRELEAKLQKAQSVNIQKNVDNGRNEAADRKNRINDYVRNSM